MVTRVRIEACGESAAEVERHLRAMATAISGAIGEAELMLGEQVISREASEPSGHTAFTGRLIVHPNVAQDAPQVAWLVAVTGACSTAWPEPGCLA